MIKAIFFDIDGTLISFTTHKMPETTKMALQMLRNRGIKLFIATGRSLKTVPGKDFLGFEFDGYAAFNGQYCVDQEQILHDMCLSVDDIQEILAYAKEHQIACQFMELDHDYYNVINDKVLELHKFLGDTIPKFKVDDTARALTNRTYQICAFIAEAEEAAFFKHLPGCKAVRWNPLFVDVIPKDGGKPVGLQNILKHYGFTREECMAFGDGGNDIEMLKYAGIGVAMGNASDKVKKTADYVTEDVDNDGIWQALLQYGLIENNK